MAPFVFSRGITAIFLSSHFCLWSDHHMRETTRTTHKPQRICAQQGWQRPLLLQYIFRSLAVLSLDDDRRRGQQQQCRVVVALNRQHPGWAALEKLWSGNVASSKGSKDGAPDSDSPTAEKETTFLYFFAPAAP